MRKSINCLLHSAVTVAIGILAQHQAVSANDREPAIAASNEVRGVIKAEEQATISSELVANVVRVPFKTGQQFARGDAIIEFDCRRYVADLAAAKAEMVAHRQTFAMNQGLRRHNAIGAHDLEISAAKLQQAEAQVAALKVRTDQCRIVAPYDGYVSERMINEHEMPQSNSPLLRIVKSGRLEIGIVVPSYWLVWLAPGVTFAFRVEETRTTHNARVIRIGAVVDPVSRTANIEAELIEPASSVRPGMSGTATFAIPDRQVAQ